MRRTRTLLLEGGLIMASIVLGAILNNPIWYVVATILTIAFLIAWALGKEDSGQEFEENKLFSGTIPAVPAMEESIGADFPAIIGHADLLIQRLGMGGDVTVTSDLSAYQINLGLFIRTSVATTDKPRTVSAFVLELCADTAIYSAEAERDIGDYCHRHERQVNDSWGHQTTLTVREEMDNLLARIRTTPIAP